MGLRLSTTPTLIIENLPGGGPDPVPFHLTEDLVRIGRAEESSIVIDSEEVAPTHSVISDLGGTHLLEDLGTPQGTLVNGEPVRAHYLDPGDVISIGPVTLRYVRGDRKRSSRASSSESPAQGLDLDGSGPDWIPIPRLWLKRLFGLYRWFASIGDRFSLLDDFAESLLSTFGCDRARIVLFEDKRRKPLLKISRSRPSEDGGLADTEQDEEDILEWVVNEILTDDEPVRVDAERLPDTAPMRSHLLVTPLCTCTRSLGLLLLERSAKKGRFRSADLTYASLISGQLTLYLRYTL